ncbi:hypothetical protein ATANTOWER_013358 [Ataeniobius toweri]|uniref:Uncharacterized protein n=1 Tax=Ataeniobius toweri TaxID=208326 RepID=A0ABU7BSK5_9TELE|nr:hypothetical protein [Ataeniobius toweri]
MIKDAEAHSAFKPLSVNTLKLIFHIICDSLTVSRLQQNIDSQTESCCNKPLPWQTFFHYSLGPTGSTEKCGVGSLSHFSLSPHRAHRSPRSRNGPEIVNPPTLHSASSSACNLV